MNDAASRKARGAYFTPAALADFVSRWAIRSVTDRVLEPTCGQAAFLVAAAGRFDALGTIGGQLDGIEIHRASAVFARAEVARAGHQAHIRVADFFTVAAQRRYDAVLGNPPYVRYQDHFGADRASSRQAALRAGVGLTGLASTWAAATVHAAEFLKPGGRLGLVLPAELLSVNYAADVRRYLMQRFGRVRLVLFTERVFPDVLEEVVLLLADDALAPGGTDHCELVQVQSTDDLDAQLGVEHDASAHRWWPTDSSGKWTPALIPSTALEVYTDALAGEMFGPLQQWGETTLGAVTGRNAFFAISPQRADELGLRADETLPLSPPGSRHLRGLALSPSDWASLGESGRATMLFRPGLQRRTMSAGARRYLALGEADGVQDAYKCRVRSPWWQVPVSPPADLLLTYMNADTPRFTTNSAGVIHLNSVHGVYLRPGLRTLGSSLLPLASLNTVTLLGAELVGRSYGGGILKLEPREADHLPLPSPTVVTQVAPQLRAARPLVRDALAAGDLGAAVALVDAIVLRGHLGLSSAHHAEVVAAQAMLAARRAARGRRAG